MRIVLLVGPKGCGKTTLGRWLEEDLGERFLEVETIAQRVLAERGGVMGEGYAQACFDAIRAAVDQLPEPLIIMETTGAAAETQAFLDGLRAKHDVLLVRVRASANTCEWRIARRDSSRQVPVPRELIDRMHAATEALGWSWDLELDNDEGIARQEVSARVRALLE